MNARESLTVAGEYLHYIHSELMDSFYRSNPLIRQQAERVKEQRFQVDHLLSILAADAHTDNAIEADIMNPTSALYMLQGLSAITNEGTDCGLYVRKTKKSPQELIGLQYIVAPEKQASMQVQWNLDDVPFVGGVAVSFDNPQSQATEYIMCVPVSLASQKEEVVRQFMHLELESVAPSDVILLQGRHAGVKVTHVKNHRQTIFYVVNVDTAREDGMLLYVGKC